MLAAFFLAVHATYVYHGRQVVSAAAQEALFIAQLEGGDDQQARQTAQELLGLFPALKAPGAGQSVAVSRNGAETRITVTVQAHIETPFFNFGTDLSSTVEGPIERFYEENQRNDQ